MEREHDQQRDEPGDCEMTVTGIVGSRRETSPPEKSATPQVAADASASRTAARVHGASFACTARYH